MWANQAGRTGTGIPQNETPEPCYGDGRVKGEDIDWGLFF